MVVLPIPTSPTTTMSPRRYSSPSFRPARASAWSWPRNRRCGSGASENASAQKAGLMAAVMVVCREALSSHRHLAEDGHAGQTTHLGGALDGRIDQVARVRERDADHETGEPADEGAHALAAPDRHRRDRRGHGDRDVQDLGRIERAREARL